MKKTILILFCLVFVAAQPVGTVHAQMSLRDTLTTLKEKVTDAITKNIKKLEESGKALSVSISVSKDGASIDVTGPNGGSVSGKINKDGASGEVKSSKGGGATGSVSKNGASGEVKSSKGDKVSGSVGKDGLRADAKTSSGGDYSISVDANGIASSLSVPNELKKKLQEANDKAIAKLKDLKAKVDAADTVEKAKAVAKEFDEKFEDFAVAHVQARVTKTIDTLTKVLDGLRLVAAKIQTQVTKVKECIQGVKSGEGSANVGLNANGLSVAASAPGCDDLNVELHRDDIAASLQSKLDEAKSTMQTIRSFLSSSIGLIAQLKDGNFSGTLTSFNGISDQLDIVLELSANVKDSLVEIALSVRKA